MRKFLFVTLIAIAVTLTACKSKTTEVKKPTACDASNVVKQVENGGFEAGDLTGWTVEGEAFKTTSVMILQTYWQNEGGIKYNQTGNFHLIGNLKGLWENGDEEPGDETLTGSMKSSTFTLCGDGKISFKLGAGRNLPGEDTELFVEVRLKDGDQLIATQTNDKWHDLADLTSTLNPANPPEGLANTYATYTLDLKQYIGKEMYVKVVDNAARGNFGFINFDDLKTYYVNGQAVSQDNGPKYLQKYLTKEPINCANFDTTANSKYEIQNPGFESGNLCGWTAEGEAFGHEVVISDPTHWGEQIPNHHDGNYHLFGMIKEPKTGTLTSSTFELGGTGWVTFRLGAAKNKSTYIQFIDASTNESIANIHNTEFTNKNFPNPDLGYREGTLVLYKLNLSAHIGKNLYIKLVDNSSGDWGQIHLDDVRTLWNAEPTIADFPNYIPNWDETATGKPRDIAVAQTFILDSIAPVFGETNNQATTVVGQPLSEPVLIVKTGITATDDQTNPRISCNTDGIDWNTVGDVSIKCTASDLALNTAEITITVKIAANYDVTNAPDYGTNVNQITNGDFETGDFTGWTVEYGTAFSNNLNIVNTDWFWGEQVPFYKEGTYFYDGTLNVPAGASYENAVGAIYSTKFTLAGSGWITFMLGGNQTAGKLSVIDATTGEEVAYYINTQFNDLPGLGGYESGAAYVEAGGKLGTMTRFKADLSEYLGKDLYIRVEDYSVGGHGYMVVDGINVNWAQEPTDTNFAGYYTGIVTAVNQKAE